jgi:hypothetical protein
VTNSEIAWPSGVLNLQRIGEDLSIRRRTGFIVIQIEVELKAASSASGGFDSAHNLGRYLGRYHHGDLELRRMQFHLKIADADLSQRVADARELRRPDDRFYSLHFFFAPGCGDIADSSLSVSIIERWMLPLLRAAMMSRRRCTAVTF